MTMKKGGRRPTTRPDRVPGMFGHYAAAVALLASPTQPVDGKLRERIAHRALEGYRAATGQRATVGHWHDLCCVRNFLQSLIELEWATDPADDIGRVDLTLHRMGLAIEAGRAYEINDHDAIALGRIIDTVDEVCAQLAARSYWAAVKHMQERCEKLLRTGKAKAGDVLVMI